METGTQINIKPKKEAEADAEVEVEVAQAKESEEELLEVPNISMDYFFLSGSRVAHVKTSISIMTTKELLRKKASSCVI